MNFFFFSWNATLHTESNHKRMEHVLYFIWTLFFYFLSLQMLSLTHCQSESNATFENAPINWSFRVLFFKTGEIFAANNFKLSIKKFIFYFSSSNYNKIHIWNNLNIAMSLVYHNENDLNWNRFTRRRVGENVPFYRRQCQEDKHDALNVQNGPAAKHQHTVDLK